LHTCDSRVERILTSASVTCGAQTECCAGCRGSPSPTRKKIAESSVYCREIHSFNKKREWPNHVPQPDPPLFRTPGSSLVKVSSRKGSCHFDQADTHASTCDLLRPGLPEPMFSPERDRFLVSLLDIEADRCGFGECFHDCIKELTADHASLIIRMDAEAKHVGIGGSQDASGYESKDSSRFTPREFEEHIGRRHSVMAGAGYSMLCSSYPEAGTA